MPLARVQNIIKNFSKARILVIGDLILDQYIFGDVDRISPEAPVPIVRAKKRQYMPGGASNVAANIVALGAKAALAGVVGRDDPGKTLFSQLKEKKINALGVVKASGRRTILKTRVLGQKQQVVRVDWEDDSPLPGAVADKLNEYIRKNWDKFDAIIIEDYGKGVITQDLLSCLRGALSKRKIITVDPKEEHFDIYRTLQISSITPNRKEAETAIRYIKIRDRENRLEIYNDKLTDDSAVDLAGSELRRYLDSDSVVITLGEQGMKLFLRDGKVERIPTFAQEVYDVSGAGDTVIAALTLALAAGAGFQDAAFIANHAAGIVVGKLGVATTTIEELLERIKRHRQE